MKQKPPLIIAVLATLVLLALSACNSFSSNGVDALPTVMIDSTGSNDPPASGASFGGGVVASGNISPASRAQIAFALGGQLDEVFVSTGNQVLEGDVLAVLGGTEQLQAAFSAAELVVLNARNELKIFLDNADFQAAQAQLELANALDQQHTAGYNFTVQQSGNRASNATINAAEASLILAKDARDRAKKAYDRLSGRADDDRERALALSNYAAAQRDYDSALRNMNWYTGHPTEIQQSQLDAEVALADARVASAQAEWDRLSNGPDPDQLEILEARVKNAEDQANAARAALENLQLSAPFTGTVSKLMSQRGEWVLPGQPVLVLADLDHLQVKTTDLSERDISRVEVGQSVMVLVEALNETVAGHVIEISPLADTLGGDVVYETTVQLDETLPDLRAGMSAEVQFE
jgi:multidrug efflux pump subunit AcrA (membrane-fusion protein)